MQGLTQGYANGGQSTYPATLTPTSTTPLDELSGQLSGAQDRIAKLIAHVRSIADTLVGPRGEKAGSGGQTAPIRAGKLGVLADNVQSLHGGLDVLEQEIARLESIG